MDKNLIELLKAAIPIVQSILWIIVIFIIIIIWRKRFSSFFDSLSKRISGGSSLKIGLFELGEIKEKISKVNDRQNDQETILNAIKIALGGIINKYELEHLKKIWKESDDIVRFGPHFFLEIEHLDSIGFLMPTKREGLIAMKKYKDGEEFHLREYTSITEKGKNYLSIVLNLV